MFSPQQMQDYDPRRLIDVEEATWYRGFDVKTPSTYPLYNNMACLSAPRLLATAHEDGSAGQPNERLVI